MTKSIVAAEVPFRIVDLLSDSRGAYGIGVNPSPWAKSLIYGADYKIIRNETQDDIDDDDDDEFILDEADKHYECERIEHQIDQSIQDRYGPLVLRPDVIHASAVFPNKYRNTLLHTIGNKCWIDSYEWTLLDAMHEAALARNERFIELQQEDKVQRQNEWWNGEKGKLYRRIKWGQKKAQLILLNRMLKRLIAEAADPTALKLARRFHPIVRENIYRAAAISQRARQLIDVFPALGVVIYCPVEESEHWEKAPDAAKMVERGAKLSQIAGFMQIPMSARRLKPAVAPLCGYLPSDLACYLPEKTWEQRLWLRPFMCRSIKTDDTDFALWIARNVLKIGKRIRPVMQSLEDVSDWIDEGKRERPRCISRRFSPDMSWATVQRENSLWHEAVAKRKRPRSRYKIPAPWLPSGHANGYSIVPLDSAQKLWQEGLAMHHCVGSYDQRVASGACYIYSVRQGAQRIATVELVRSNGVITPGQMRGKCNEQPPKEVGSAVRKWLAENR